MQSVPVYVVSLKEAIARRAIIEAHLRGLGIEYEMIDAVRGDALDPGYRKSINPAGNMSPGALGCYLSHVYIYQRMIEGGVSVALILEDDSVLHYSVAPLVESGCQSLEFDYCFLGSEDQGDEGYVFFDAERSLKLSGEHTAYVLSSGPYCTNAYLVTLEGAKKRVSCAFPARTAIDHYHFLPYQPRFMAIVPMVAFVNEQSTVESMSSVTWSNLQRKVRKYWWYYPLRDIVKLKAPAKLIALQKVKRTHPGRWRSFESAFRIVARRRYVR